jgi:hypothetical protein
VGPVPSDLRAQQQSTICTVDSFQTALLAQLPVADGHRRAPEVRGSARVTEVVQDFTGGRSIQTLTNDVDQTVVSLDGIPIRVGN